MWAPARCSSRREGSAVRSVLSRLPPGLSSRSPGGQERHLWHGRPFNSALEALKGANSVADQRRELLEKPQPPSQVLAIQAGNSAVAIHAVSAFSTKPNLASSLALTPSLASNLATAMASKSHVTQNHHSQNQGQNNVNQMANGRIPGDTRFMQTSVQSLGGARRRVKLSFSAKNPEDSGTRRPNLRMPSTFAWLLAMPNSFTTSATKPRKPEIGSASKINPSAAAAASKPGSVGTQGPAGPSGGSSEESAPEHAVHGSAVNSKKNSSPPLNWKTVQRALMGNSFITLLKFGVWWQTGSAAMLSEAIHTLADSGNQALLLAGLHQSSNAPDGRFQYGYGRAAFFWALVSALGMFWTGAGVAIFHGGYNLLHPEGHAVETSLALWGVLGISFLVDGWVLRMTLKELYDTKPPEKSMWKYLWSIRDPFIMAVIMEDTTACTGVILATLGVGATHYTGSVYWDAMASLGIGALLGLVALQLVRMNQKFLLGHAIDQETLSGIRKILIRRPSVEAVYGVQSQWVGPSTFSYKAEVDFDGTYLAAHLEDKYAPLFMTATEREDVEVLMSWYAEDVTRLVEREVRDIEDAIRNKYPAAAFIELEPDSKYSDVEALPLDPTYKSPYYNDEQEEMRKVDSEIERQLHRTKSM